MQVKKKEKKRKGKGFGAFWRNEMKGISRKMDPLFLSDQSNATGNPNFLLDESTGENFSLAPH